MGTLGTGGQRQTETRRSFPQWLIDHLGDVVVQLAGLLSGDRARPERRHGSTYAARSVGLRMNARKSSSLSSSGASRSGKSDMIELPPCAWQPEQWFSNSVWPL